MNTPILLASGSVAVSIAYRWLVSGSAPNDKTIIAWGITLLTLAILAKTSLEPLANLFAYLITLIIALNDIYGLLSALVQG